MDRLLSYVTLMGGGNQNTGGRLMIDCKGQHLEAANYAYAKLEHSVFERAFLHEANFSKADLRDCNFRQAHLKDSNFSGADLSAANFEETDLEMARLEGAKYNQKTSFPAGFEPERHKMVNLESLSGNERNEA